MQGLKLIYVSKRGPRCLTLPNGARPSAGIILIMTAKDMNFSKFLWLLTPLGLETDHIPALGVNNMPVDALSPKVARASAGMVLSV